MAEFTTCCPSCGFSFSADESYVGLTTTCAGCSKDFVIQAAGEAVASKAQSQIRPDQILVTSGDLSAAYEVIGMVCINVGTRGEMKNFFDHLKTVVSQNLASPKFKGQLSPARGVGQMIGGLGIDSGGGIALTGQYAGASFNSRDLELAFHIVVNQLQLRASYLNANAIVAFRYDVDLDSNSNVLNFVATAYGTAVRLV